MDGHWGHYVKWNKSNREREILYPTYIWNLKKKKLKDTENRLVVASGGSGQMGEGGQEVQTSSYKVKKS